MRLRLWHRRKPQQTVSSTAPHDYQLWYYNSLIWDSTTWEGVKALKSPMDMWNYQEIIYERRPTLVIEFGTRFGGGTLYFASVLRKIPGARRVLTVDVDRDTIDPKVFDEPLVEVMTSSSNAPEVAARIRALREEYPGPVFAILDSNHSRAHVFSELLLLRPILRKDDYVIVEDSNLNGHPVVPNFGPGPFEAIEEYMTLYPDEFQRDTKVEKKFGFTFAPNGFLIRR